MAASLAPCCAVTTAGAVTCIIWRWPDATVSGASAGNWSMPVWRNSARPAFKMQHLHLRQQCGRHEVLGAHRLEAANGIAGDANPTGRLAVTRNGTARVESRHQPEARVASANSAMSTNVRNAVVDFVHTNIPRILHASRLGLFTLPGADRIPTRTPRENLCNFIRQPIRSF